MSYSPGEQPVRIPNGTVTFPFTDIEGSPACREGYPAQMQSVPARHGEILRSAVQSHGGYVFETVGDVCCAAFGRVRPLGKTTSRKPTRTSAPPSGAACIPKDPPSTVNVIEVFGDTATAEVDVSFVDNTGNPRFSLAWSLVKEHGEWKLDEVVSGGQVN